MDPQNARSRRTRAALLEAAREIVEGQGLEALTMGAVGDRAGVTRRTVYLRFESRTALVTALFEHVNEAEELAESLRPVHDASDAAAALAAWAAHVARFHPRIARVARAVQAMRDADADAAEHWRLVQADWYRICRELAERTRDEGVLADGWTVERMADMLQALMSFDILDTLVGLHGWSADACAAQLGRLAHSTFLRPGTPITAQAGAGTTERRGAGRPSARNSQPAPR
ncbi:TetR/AcrR family transcriptional regulator [Agromyces aurantiacus]|uniref:TetR/AcrR family transcriptional regulator n=1 Tax=Agromyces aurantiacus TaxID=165814 RepID=A0ABV9R0Y1_9MICO|nr:TetR/AcrR family transcriptional regulator [Agromyces aurantiacus]MBM7505801.1 AcrR family transcriptional regulator [Agromyces aurantiacus]